jgi:tyramine---L-glutamate ligase
VRVFISELLTSGAWKEPNHAGSLLKEGAAMLKSIVADFARVPGCRVVTTWDVRCGKSPFENGIDNVRVRIVSDPAQEPQAFEEECRSADAALIIAPEFDNLLAERCRRVTELGTFSLNCSVDSIRLCADKLQLARRLETLGLPTIPTRELADLQKTDERELEFPLVIKPRDGAGSQETYLISNAAAWFEFVKHHSSGPFGGRVLQPFVPGRTLSIAALVGEEQWNGEPWLEVLPLAEQVLTQDGRFGYLGGRMPDTIFLQHEATHLVREAVRRIPGLSGYIGFDLVAPKHAPETLWIVEINPRLTTSYLGYRELADQNLAEYMIPEFRPEEPLRWKPQIVQFTADGSTRVAKPPGERPA